MFGVLNPGSVFQRGQLALAELPFFERIFHVFWLFGPIVLLLERSPADAWLIIIGLVFLVRTFIKRDFQFIRPFWVKSGIAFWCICLISSLLSEAPIYSLGEAVAWVRFPLFTFACVFWLGRDKRILYLMLLISLIGLVLMCSILLLEILIEGHKNGRLSWPYGDLVPGNYLAKVSLPAFCILVALASSAGNRVALISGLISIISLLFSFLTGERINFLIRFFSAFLSIFIWKPRYSHVFALLFPIMFILLLSVIFFADLNYRYIEKFLEQLPINSESSYFKAMAPGVVAFLQEPFFGIGTGNLRHMCPSLLENHPEFICHPHPHNFYIQLAGETGLIGLLFGTIYLFSIFWVCFRQRNSLGDEVFVSTAWVTPLALFWPLATAGDFFGQWNNIFMWFGVALSLCSTNLVENKKS